MYKKTVLYRFVTAVFRYVSGPEWALKLSVTELRWGWDLSYMFFQFIKKGAIREAEGQGKGGGSCNTLGKVSGPKLDEVAGACMVFKM